jgi:hypothetical protein
MDAGTDEDAGSEDEDAGSDDAGSDDAGSDDAGPDDAGQCLSEGTRCLDGPPCCGDLGCIGQDDAGMFVCQ